MQLLFRFFAAAGKKTEMFGHFPRANPAYAAGVATALGLKR